MFGFVIGTACLIGLVSILHGGRHHRLHRRWGAHRWGRERMLQFLFSRLDTRPDQEDVIRRAADSLHRTADQTHERAHKAREDVARAVRTDRLDVDVLGSTLADSSIGIDEARKELVSALASVHAVLDDEQRRRLSELIAGHWHAGACWGSGHNYAGV